MLYCTNCEKTYGFPATQDPAPKEKCGICGKPGLVGRIHTSKVPLQNRLDLANLIQSVLDDVHRYSDEKPTPIEFLKEVRQVMLKKLNPNLRAAGEDEESE